MKTNNRRSPGAFTLMEVMIVIAIILLLAALLLNIGHPQVGTKRALTTTSLKAIEGALESYHAKFGEYPEPADPDEMAEIMPGKRYRIGGAKCLYQALTGDGQDAIRGSGGDRTASDGQVDDGESLNRVFKDMPPAMWRKAGGSYILVDGFGRPFQYTPATGGSDGTINTGYDLWSFAEDETDLTAESTDTRGNAALGAKWIKNW
ncbi:MAG: prepilin-type N-terminal cleavage/methylation domain-containing protein [Verrucomicrobiaceae bacterium]|nr:prepilin-type N-terminal cleavage/methylation domain-containing protein [Verrucomicrobiaceae bacterium]